jgi:hypothetical protein
MTAGTAAGAAAAVLRITEIIITPGGALEGIFTYSSNPPAAGTLIESASVAAAGTDAYGNHYLAGHATYAAGFATALDAGYVAFYTGSLSAGWAFVAQLLTDAGGDLFLLTAGGTLELTAAGAFSVSGFSVDSGGSVTMGADLNLTPQMGAISGYPFDTVTEPVPGSVAVWGANVDGVLNALVNGVNQLIGEMNGRGMIA